MASSSGQREAWIDGFRGLCVLFMVEVHLLDAWLDRGLAHGLAFHTLRFLGGFAAPGFLFLAGLALAKKDASMVARGATLRERRVEGLRRGAYVLGVAYTFRLVEYVLGGALLKPGAWVGIFKVDILNVIGVATMLVTLTVVQRTRLRSLTATLALLVVVVLAHPSLAAREHELLGGYLYARKGFAVVNWAGFALAGALFAQVLVRGVKSLHVVAVGALVLGAGVLYESLPPVFAVQDFWRSSPEWFIQRLGLLVLTAGVVRGAGASLRHSRWITRLGRHSLMAYMVSVDLTYGGLARPFRHALPLWGVLAATAGMTALLTLVAWLLERRGERKRAIARADAVSQRLAA